MIDTIEPTEKAKELVRKFQEATDVECAIIMVEELIKEASDNIYQSERGKLSNKEYWQKVKAEIEIL